MPKKLRGNGSLNLVMFLCAMTILFSCAAVPQKISAQTENKKPDAPELINLKLYQSYSKPDVLYTGMGCVYPDKKAAVFRIYKREGAYGTWYLQSDSKTATVGMSSADHETNSIRTTYYYYCTATINGVESDPSEIKQITIDWNECADTDSDAQHRTGVNYFVRGTLNGKTDYCWTPTTLTEYFCTEGGGTGNTGYQCPNGCSLGACLAKGQTAIATNATSTGAINAAANNAQKLIQLQSQIDQLKGLIAMAIGRLAIVKLNPALCDTIILYGKGYDQVQACKQMVAKEISEHTPI